MLEAAARHAVDRRRRRLGAARRPRGGRGAARRWRQPALLRRAPPRARRPARRLPRSSPPSGARCGCSPTAASRSTCRTPGRGTWPRRPTWPAALPELRIVVDHLGKPPFGGADWDAWRATLAEVAARPNTVAKVSGLQVPGTPFTRRAVRPAWEVALELFGPERLMWGSDWPMTVLAGGYGRTWEVMSSLIAELSADEQAQILSRTTARRRRYGDLTVLCIDVLDRETSEESSADRRSTRSSPGTCWRTSTRWAIRTPSCSPTPTSRPRGSPTGCSTFPGCRRRTCSPPSAPCVPLDDPPALDLMASADGDAAAGAGGADRGGRGGEDDVRFLDRHAFYDVAADGYLIVRTGETRTYGNVILRKGVVTERGDGRRPLLLHVPGRQQELPRRQGARGHAPRPARAARSSRWSGENGAGKSTLMKLLSGIYDADEGEFFLNGEPYEPISPKHAQELGISIIHQEFNLMPDLTVAQNIFIGREPRGSAALPQRAPAQRAGARADRAPASAAASPSSSSATSRSPSSRWSRSPRRCPTTPSC